MTSDLKETITQTAIPDRFDQIRFGLFVMAIKDCEVNFR
jgi:hypothetical protein